MKEKKPYFKLILIMLVICIFPIHLCAQGMDLDKKLHISNIPYPLSILNSPLDIKIENDAVIKIVSKGKTNLFNSPGDNFYKQDAPMLLFHPDSNFTFCARVEADLVNVYDVAALVLYQNKDLWTKLCFENSIDKEATVVSVVTKRFSDDCNSIKINDNFVYLCVIKKADELSFHYSTDNVNWHLIRHFRIDFNESKLMVGYAVHCSRGDSFSAEFSDIKYSPNALDNMRQYK